MTAVLRECRERPARTGRPYRPPEERLAPETPVAPPRLRTAWLLGTTRMLARDGRFAHRRDFVAALIQRGFTCDESRVSRWESGALPAGTAVIAAYEEILGLAPYQLRGAVDLVRPPGSPAFGAVLQDDGVHPHQRLDDLLTAALDSRADGLEWLELAQRVGSTDGFYLREADWQVLARTLVTEYCRSVAVGYLARTGALGALISHPRAQRHVLRAVGEVVLDLRIARRAEPVHLLSLIPGPQTTPLTLRLAESDDPLVRTQAIQALAAMVADSDGEYVDQPLVEMLVRQLRLDPAGTDLADVAARLPSALLEQVQAGVRSKSLLQVISTHESVSRETAVACTRQLTAVANPATAHPRIEADGMLSHLIRDGLFHSHARRRTAALSVLAASEYAGRLGDGLALLIDHHDPVVASSALEAMAWFARDRHDTALAAVATSIRPPWQRRLALTALGCLPSAPSEPVAQAVSSCLADPVREVAREAVATLGMHGLAGQITGVDAELDSAARWWQDAGPRLAR